MKSSKWPDLKYLLVTKPVNDMPFVWGTLAIVVIFSAAAASMYFDSVVRGVPEESDLNVTHGILEKIYENRRGVYISVIDDVDGRRWFFPGRGGYIVSKSPAHEWIWQSIGEPVRILWWRPLSLSGLLLGRKKVWGLRISNRDVYVFEEIAEKRAASQLSENKAFWISALLLIVIPLGVGIRSCIQHGKLQG